MYRRRASVIPVIPAARGRRYHPVRGDGDGSVFQDPVAGIGRRRRRRRGAGRRRRRMRRRGRGNRRCVGHGRFARRCVGDGRVAWRNRRRIGHGRGARWLVGEWRKRWHRRRGRGRHDGRGPRRREQRRCRLKPRELPLRLPRAFRVRHDDPALHDEVFRNPALPRRLLQGGSLPAGHRRERLRPRRHVLRIVQPHRRRPALPDVALQRLAHPPRWLLRVHDLRRLHLVVQQCLPTGVDPDAPLLPSRRRLLLPQQCARLLQRRLRRDLRLTLARALHRTHRPAWAPAARTRRCHRTRTRSTAALAES